MTKDEMKNRISMALKDPILQQCFEIICKENTELRKVAELLVGSTFNKALNSMNKYLEEERDKYRNMVFDKIEQIDKAKDLLLRFIELKNKPCAVGNSVNMLLYENIRSEAEQFLKEIEK